MGPAGGGGTAGSRPATRPARRIPNGPRSDAPAPARGPGRSVLVVEAGQPAGQPVHGDVEAGVEVDEVSEPFGEPGHRDLLLAAPVLEFLDAAVGEVHQFLWGIAVSMISRWVVACSLA